MKRLIKVLLLLVVLLVAIACFSSGWLLARATDAALPWVERLLSDHGIEASDIVYRRVGLGGLTKAIWSDVEAVVGLPENESGQSDQAVARAPSA